MQVLVVVIDDNGNSQTFQLEKYGESRRYVKVRAGGMGDPLIGKAWVAKDFKAEKKI